MREWMESKTCFGGYRASMAWQWWAEISPGTDGHVVALVIRQDREAGVDLVAFGRDGQEVELTWHGGKPLAEAWAAERYGRDAIGPWGVIPDDERDPIRYVLRTRS
jgi:hypothetical protein